MSVCCFAFCPNSRLTKQHHTHSQKGKKNEMRRFSPILSANLQHRKKCVKVAGILVTNLSRTHKNKAWLVQEVSRGRPFPLGLLDDDRGLRGCHHNCGGVGGVGSRHRQPGNSLSTETLQKITILSKTSAQHSFTCHLFKKRWNYIIFLRSP